MWTGIVGDRVIGPIFSQGYHNGAEYLEYFQEELVPDLVVLFFADPVEGDVPNRNIWFQQDGAPPHFAGPVSIWDDVFPGRWIGRGRPFEWPARSPDLTPIDYFLWGYLKNKVFKTKPENINEFKERMQE